MTEAFAWDTAPRYLVRDRDAVYGHVVRQRLRVLGIWDRLTASQSPRQNAHVERLIGSILRECLDHMFVPGESHLRRIVSRYVSYYNEVRTHLSLAKDTPISRPIELVYESQWRTSLAKATEPGLLLRLEAPHPPRT
jgi:transposase InsO family protein